jgi:molybdopterin converting factor small subunit
MITVRLPSTLRVSASDTLMVHEPVATIADLIDVLDRRIPGFSEQLNDSVFNFAVNDEMLLYHARDRALNAGDVVEVIPTISGGADAA